MPLVTVTSIAFSDGTRIPVPESGTVIFVGPNNAGKSQALRDLRGHIQSRTYKGLTLSCSYSEVDIEEFGSWADANIPKTRQNGFEGYSLPNWGPLPTFELLSQWNSARNNGLGGLIDLAVLHADGSSRLSAGSSQPSFDRSSEPPTHPLHLAYARPELEAAIDQACQSAFGLGLSVDRWGGSMISLRVGERPDFHHNQGAPTNTFIDELHSLPKLEEQGDGVRSYVGLLLHILGGGQSVLLVDEPEAFLHPPQAKRLGQVLASHSKDVQVFVSTHSADVVQGALEADSHVTIVRITREGNVNPAAVLSDADVSGLWSDPLLRYSNVLDGLFNDVVVLCEGDADCRYYSALLDEYEQRCNDDLGETERRPQVLFTHSGGKARLHSLIRALRSVKVPVVAVADFDVLRNDIELQRIVEQLGGQFDPLRQDLQVLRAALTSPSKALQRVTLKRSIIDLLDANPKTTVDQAETAAIRGLLKSDSGWDKTKTGGLTAVPQGDAWRAAESLLAQLEGIGLLVVPVGELERFVPTASGHGPAWVAEVLTQKLHATPSPDAIAFAQKLRRATRSAAGWA